MWPQGFYTLPKAASGCPGSTNFTWKQGWIFQDLDDTDVIMTKASRSFNMAAKIDDWGNIKRWFCTKNNVTHNEEMIRPVWPKGKVCPFIFGCARFFKSFKNEYACMSSTVQLALYF